MERLGEVMEEKAKIQIGDMLLDGVIDMEQVDTSQDTTDIREAWKHIRASLMQSFSFTMQFEEGTPGIIDDNVVEGSITEPITDPTKLLE